MEQVTFRASLKRISTDSDGEATLTLTIPRSDAKRITEADLVLKVLYVAIRTGEEPEAVVTE